MTAYYNEIDPFAATWLRELIKAGHIAPGEVDERSIEDVRPSDLAGFTQCHFFAGIGVWSYALRSAGWPDERPVWTGSCPCQPFSAAGKRGGTSDERHLWPSLFHLIKECRPASFFGEQVASKDGLAWFDTVQADLEGSLYAVGVCDLCAAGFGAPHIRQRLYFVADSQRDGWREERSFVGRIPSGNSPEGFTTRLVPGSADSRSVVNASGEQVGLSGCSRESRGTSGCAMDNSSDSRRDDSRQCDGGSPLLSARSEQPSRTGDLGDTNDSGPQGRIIGRLGTDQLPSGAPGLVNGGTVGDTSSERRQQVGGSSSCDESSDGRQSDSDHILAGPSLTNGFWREADWIYCRDEKYRPVEAGTFPLAHGIANRVGKLRGYGNAIVAPVATAFIESYLEVEGDRASRCPDILSK